MGAPFTAVLPVGSNGIGYGIFDGGINSDPGTISLFPAIPIGDLTAVTPWLNGGLLPKVAVLNHGGWVYIEVTGANPGNSTPVAWISYT